MVETNINPKNLEEVADLSGHKKLFLDQSTGKYYECLAYSRRPDFEIDKGSYSIDYSIDKEYTHGEASVVMALRTGDSDITFKNGYELRLVKTDGE